LLSGGGARRSVAAAAADRRAGTVVAFAPAAATAATARAGRVAAAFFASSAAMPARRRPTARASAGVNDGGNDSNNPTTSQQPPSLPLPVSLALGGGIVLLAVGTLAALTHHGVNNGGGASDALDPTDLVGAVQRLLAAADPESPAVALAFVGAYASAAVLMLPAALLTLFAGAAFGPLRGTGLVFVGATAGACLAFLVARYVARPIVQPRLPERFAAVDAAIAAQGARVVLLLRLSPLIPFGILNYSLGLSRIGFIPYALASVGMLPAIVAYTFIGSTAATAAAAGAAGVGAAGEAQAIKFVLYGVGAAATLLATKLISDAAGKALAEAEREAAAGGGGGGP
jgi:uncharacterized membrane protein YdjX (TVP38/TMEM64 family)